jgi:GNAT superfamily N-acetyltransferase
MQLLTVRDKKTENAFFNVCKLIYVNDKNYIPHLRQDIEKIFDPAKNKLFRQGGDAIRWILQDDQGKTIGRVAAFIHPKTSKTGTYKLGGMGFFECINNQEAAKTLLDTCKSWLIEKGMDGMDGPINFGEKDNFWGLLTENFTAMPSYGMNYNPSYYQHFFEDYGFKLYFKQLVFWRDLTVPAQEIFVKKAGMVSTDPSFKVINMQGVKNEKIAEYFLEVYNSAWGVHEGFKEMRIEQARNIIKAMKVIMDRDILLFAFMGEKPIGFYLSIPELNEFFKHVNGNLNWWGKLKFLYHLKLSKRKTMLGIVFGVSKEYQGRGVEGALIKYCGDFVVPMGRYTETILTWIGDFNPRMLKVIENLGTELHRTLVTYRLYFNDQIPFERHPIIGGKNKDQPAENQSESQNDTGNV